MVLHVRLVPDRNERQRKSWFDGRLGGTLFGWRIVVGVQSPTLVKNGNDYELISMNNIQLV